MMDYLITSGPRRLLGLDEDLGRDEDLGHWPSMLFRFDRISARTEIDALLRKLKGAQFHRGKYFWESKFTLREIFGWGMYGDSYNSLLRALWIIDSGIFEGESNLFGGQRLRLKMEALVGRWVELMTTNESKSRELETEIMSQVRSEMREFGQSFYDFHKWEFDCWAKARKRGTSEANANFPLWIRRAEAEPHVNEVVEARRKITVAIEEMDRRVEAVSDAAAEEMLRRVEAQKLITGSATATNSDLDNNMWTSILAELVEEATTLSSIASTQADELSRYAHAIVAKVRTKKASGAFRFSRRALAVAGEVWRKAGPEAEEVWRRAAAANLMKAAEEEYMQSLENMLTRLMATEGGEEEDLQKKKQDEGARLVYAVAMSAVALLALVYLYLVGLIDRGGTKTYSPGSRVFRSTFASIVLVLGFYVWFKFRDPATRIRARRGYCRPGQTVIEARYKPPRESGNNNYISFGPCATHEEAGIKKEIAAFYYGRPTGWLDFEDDHPFHIPPAPSGLANLSVEEKRDWVKSKVMEVYEDVKRFRASIAQLGQSGANLGHHLPNPPAEQSEQGPPVAWNPEFRVEDMDPSQDVAAGSSKFDVENFPDSPGVMTDLPFLLDAEPQLVQKSTLDLQLALKLISCLEQRVVEKDRQNEEQARTIVELKREVERLRSFPEH